MDFNGFDNSDFDFLKKKDTMSKAECDERKEDIKRHFREFCYQIQKIYHSQTEKTLPLDKDFQGLNKGRSYITARAPINGLECLGLSIVMNQDNISINLVCPPDDDYMKFQQFKEILSAKMDTFIRFFKENKNAFLMLSKRNYKKAAINGWDEEYKFGNNELCYGDYRVLAENMEKLQPFPVENKKLAGIHIRIQYAKAEAVKMGKQLPVRACSTGVIKLLDLCNNIIQSN